MKKIIFLAGLYFITTTATAQLNTTLVLAATPPATLSNWGNQRDVLTYIINSQAGLSIPVIIKTEIITTDGTVIGTTDLAKAPILTLSTSPTILFANDVLPLENFLFSGKYKSSMDKTGKLPSDNYTLCVQLVRPIDFTPVAEVKCKSFYLVALQLPILMKPYNEEVLDARIAQTAITFRWTPVVPRLKEPVTYLLQVFEVLDDQTPMQALRSNQPVLNKEIKAATQFIWQPQLPFLPDDNKVTDKAVKQDMETALPKEKIMTGSKVYKFIWSIQSLDLAGNPVTQSDGNGEGRSEPIVFIVDPNKNNPLKNEK